MKNIIQPQVVVFLGCVALAILLLLSLTANVLAKQEDKIYWCHTEPNGNHQTLHLPQQALENAGHVNAQGNPLHAGDHAGECLEVSPSPSPSLPPASPEPTPEVSPEPSVEPRSVPTTEPMHTTVVSVQTSVVTPTQCADSVPHETANIFVDSGVPNDNKLEVRWLPAEGASRAHIVYAEYGQPWSYALLDTENDGHEVIGGLKNGQNYYFQVAGVNGCAVGPWSTAFDPKP